ncbi:murein L,D-transpeptidase YcbB/YkuD [Sphingomonas zeicaulis]|uniref:L,D-transpeptidase family protein n=1 Tax=Sphingomonas zeicaulis TaxID=1632740 RepID=UPI003D19E47F
MTALTTVLKALFPAALVATASLAAASPAIARERKPKAAAAPAPAPVSTLTATLPALPQAAAVNAYYDRWGGPAWFSDGGRSVTALTKIIRRGQLDGIAEAPKLATEIERAAAVAAKGNAADRRAAEQFLSTTWVAYVEAIRKPVQNMIYGYPALAPKQAGADEILAAAAAAPSLATHLESVATVNPIYAELRDAAWAEMGANPAATPDARILLNLARLRSLPTVNRFALVNIATQTLMMYENGRQVDSMKVIVGTKEQLTPMISSVIYYTTFNPYWNVPDHLIRKTVAPNMLKMGPSYLNTRGYQVMSDWSEKATVVPASAVDWKAVVAGTKKIRVRQLPGPGNSMGKLKFSFANGADIFLHDTPSKGLFAKPDRYLSNGCIRLEDARRFGRWLLQKEPTAPSAEPEQFVQLPAGVPVYITYLTAREANGKITYANDIYGWDGPRQQMVSR